MDDLFLPRGRAHRRGAGRDAGHEDVRPRAPRRPPARTASRSCPASSWSSRCSASARRRSASRRARRGRDSIETTVRRTGSAHRRPPRPRAGATRSGCAVRAATASTSTARAGQGPAVRRRRHRPAAAARPDLERPRRARPVRAGARSSTAPARRPTSSTRTSCDEWAERGDVELHVTVDRGEPGWTGNVGMVPTLFDKTELRPATTLAYVCGPADHDQVRRPGPADARVRRRSPVISTLERMMQCGVGKCNHCAIGHCYVCRDGPVFNFRQIRELVE